MLTGLPLTSAGRGRPTSHDCGIAGHRRAGLWSPGGVLPGPTMRRIAGLTWDSHHIREVGRRGRVLSSPARSEGDNHTPYRPHHGHRRPSCSPRAPEARNGPAPDARRRCSGPTLRLARQADEGQPGGDHRVPVAMVQWCNGMLPHVEFSDNGGCRPQPERPGAAGWDRRRVPAPGCILWGECADWDPPAHSLPRSLTPQSLLPMSANTLRLRGGIAENTRSAALNIDRPIRLFEMVCSAVRSDRRTAANP